MKKNVLSIFSPLKNYIVAVLVPVFLYGILMILMPNKIKLDGIPYILTQAITPAIAAWGALFSMTIGNMNFSTGAVIITSAIIGGNLAAMFNLGVIGLIIFCPIVGIICGLITGGIFVILKIPSFIVSIGVLIILESIGTLIFNGNGIFLSSEYIVFGKSINTVLFGIAVFIIAYVLFEYTAFGYHVRAIGRNPSISRNNGINVYKARFLCFAVGGLFFGLYAVMLLGTTGVQYPAAASMSSMKFVFDAIMCIYVGKSLSGKANPVIVIYLGSIVMQIIQIALTAANVQSTFTQALVAIFVLISMCYSAIREIAEEKARHKQEIESLEVA